MGAIMSSRCRVKVGGAETLGCCRLAGHLGDHHGHITTRLSTHAHATIVRGTGKLVGCAEGAAMDEPA